MAKFRRIANREPSDGETYDQPHWQEGYEFYSEDYNGDDDFGPLFVKDYESGVVHAWYSVVKVK